MKIIASAPNKLHIAGEHSVVYGGRALMSPVEVNGKRNIVTLTSKTGTPKIFFKGDYGEITIYANGESEGDDAYKPIAECVDFLLNKTGAVLKEEVSAVVSSAGAPKGTGNSASIPAALVCALYEYFGAKPSRKDLHDATFVADNAWHGGKSSGGDVNAVLSGRPQEFRLVFTGDAVKTEYQDSRIQLPQGTALILAECFKCGDKATTAEQIQKFADAHGIMNAPEELTEQERQMVTRPFDEVIREIEASCHANGDPKVLGALLDRNHLLLESVSCEEIEEARRIAKKSGAFGAKLIGAGGKGGAAIALAKERDVEGIRKALKAAGFNSFPVKFASRGACVDSIS